MNPKRQAFVREYAVSRNGLQSAIRAGYSEKTAGQIANNLLKIIEVKEALAELEAQHADKCGVTIENLTAEIEKDREQARQLGQPSAAISASMGIAKLHGLVVDRAENKNTNVNADVTDQIMKPEEWAAHHKPH